MSTYRFAFVLGAPDPEMESIELAVMAAGMSCYHAKIGPYRVRANDAYRADSVYNEAGLRAELREGAKLVFVECWCDRLPDIDHAVIIDHHRPGDPGYGRPPAEYWAASSIGQVCDLLGIEPTDELRLVAAADHCLAAAYRGECPGVNPDALMRWRVASRAAFQRRSPAELLADIEQTRSALRKAERITLALGIEPIADMRREKPWPELPEAAAREGIGYFAGPLRDVSNKLKYTCNGSPEQVRAWMNEYAPRLGIREIYGDPERGFAGGFISCV